MTETETGHTQGRHSDVNIINSWVCSTKRYAVWMVGRQMRGKLVYVLYHYHRSKYTKRELMVDIELSINKLTLIGKNRNSNVKGNLECNFECINYFR